MAESSPQSSDAGTGDGRARITLAVAALAALATYLDTTILFVAFPAITETFGQSSASTLSWVLNGYTFRIRATAVRTR